MRWAIRSLTIGPAEYLKSWLPVTSKTDYERLQFIFEEFERLTHVVFDGNIQPLLLDLEKFKKYEKINSASPRLPFIYNNREEMIESIENELRPT